MDPAPDRSYVTQRNPKACEACRQSKSKCLTSQEANTCQRCLKVNSVCSVRAVARPKRAKRALATRNLLVLEALKDADDAPDIYIKLATLPVVDTREAVAILGEHHEKALEQMFSPDEKSEIEPSFGCFANGGDQSPIEITERVQRSLTIHEAEESLNFYRSMTSYFPFVVVSKDETVQSMSRNRPFLLMAIITSASVEDVQLRNGLDHELRRIMGNEVIAMGKKSLDFLQGLLVYTCWYPCHLHPRNRQSFMFITVATSMAVELGLDKRHPTATLTLNDNIDTSGLLEGQEFSKAAKRAYLGCYYLSSAISLGFQRPNNLPYNRLIDEYGILLCSEPEIMTDFALSPLVRILELEEKIREFLKQDKQAFSNSQLQAETQLQIFQAELEEWRVSTLTEVKSMFNVGLAERFLEISLYNYDLGLFRPVENLAGDRYLDPRNLTKCLDACRRYFEYLLTIPVGQYMLFTHVQWGSIVQAIVILSRLSFPIVACPGWDSRLARERAPIVMYIDALCYRMQSITRVTAHNGGLPTNPDSAYIFKLVLESIVKKYNERLQNIEKAALSVTKTEYVDRYAPLQKRPQCPMRDPELAPLFEDEDFHRVVSSVTPESGSSVSASAPVYFDVWKTMTLSWGEDEIV